MNSALAARATGALREFNAAGVLAPADVHVAQRLAAIALEDDEQVMLAVAFAVRGPRLGHVYVDLETIRDTATVDAEEPVDLAALPWPAPAEWLERVAASRLVAVGEEGGAERPLRLVGSALYLDRYWREERQVAADLLALGAPPSRSTSRCCAAASTGCSTSTASARPPRPPCGAARVSPAAPAPARRPWWRASSPAARAGRRPVAGRARGPDRQGGRAPERGGARGGGAARHPGRRSASTCSRSRPRRCTGCSAGGPAPTAASATHARTGCRTTS